MICPKCNGASVVPGKLLTFASTETNPNQLYPCDYEGCHAGHTHCCDGIAEGWDDTDKWTLEFRWIGHNEPIPEGYELANESQSHHSRHSRLVVREYE